ncbi:MAG: ABC transporter ATP-binding protein [Actinomycetota bacterium]|nr:ABC transporter ATP-binding protein [Actinomycetota bacterium]
MDSAVQITGISKRFRLFHEQYSSLKERAIHFGRIPFDDFWALRDINLDIKPGETVGLLGRNGSGKSTLLKCVAGILQPTSGEIRTSGRLAALLELGAGFHPDLSGRENVFLNASLLGLSRREIERKFDEIVAFAEIEEHIDQQVKYYSSGMYVRLGFAVAVNMDPDILLVDEVLAVGDELFQRKCLDRVKLFQQEGRTIVFVTHSVDLVRQICDRVAVLDNGVMVACGRPGEAVRSYREHLQMHQREEEAHAAGHAEPVTEAGAPEVEEDPWRDSPIRIAGVRFEYQGGVTSTHLVSGEPLTIHLGYRTTRPVDDAVVGVAIYNTEGKCLYSTNTDYLEVDLGVLDGEGTVDYYIPSVPLLDGTYPIIVHFCDRALTRSYEVRDHQDWFEVMSLSKTIGQIELGAQVTVHPDPTGLGRQPGAA